MGPMTKGGLDDDDPYAAFNFVVDIQGMRAGFAEISGLTIETDVIEYRDGNEGITARKLPGLKKFTNINLKRGYVRRRVVREGRRQSSKPSDARRTPVYG